MCFDRFKLRINKLEPIDEMNYGTTVCTRTRSECITVAKRKKKYIRRSKFAVLPSVCIRLRASLYPTVNNAAVSRRNKRISIHTLRIIIYR